MKCNHNILIGFFLILLIHGISLSSIAQEEYDDLYFTSVDRKKNKVQKQENTELMVTSKGESRSSEELKSSGLEQENAAEMSSYYSQYTAQPYYVKDSLKKKDDGFVSEKQPTTIVNNYYGSSHANPANSYNQMNIGYSPMAWRVGFGYNWGAPRYPAYYDPFYGPSYGCDPFYSNSYAFNHGYQNGIHDANYWNHYVANVNQSNAKPTVNETKGSRYSRGAVIAGTSNLNRASSSRASRSSSAGIRNREEVKDRRTTPLATSNVKTAIATNNSTRENVTRTNSRFVNTNTSTSSQPTLKKKTGNSRNTSSYRRTISSGTSNTRRSFSTNNASKARSSYSSSGSSRKSSSSYSSPSRSSSSNSRSSAPTRSSSSRSKR